VRGRGSQARSKEQEGEITTAGHGWWFLLAPTARHDAEERRVEKRHPMMEGVSVCLFAHSLHGEWVDASSADVTRFTRAPMRGVTAIQCGVRIEGAAATKTSEVGSHRVTTGEEPAADWTDPPKRGQRRENAGSSGRFGKGESHTGSGNHRSKADDRNVIPSGTVEHGCTRVEYVDGSSLAVRISRV